MKRTFLFIVILLMFITIAVLPAPTERGNHPPFFYNVCMQQQPGARLLDIIYDVDDPDGDLLDITVAVSYDGASIFTVPDGAFTGNFGKGITPGPGNQIIWNATVHVPDEHNNDYYVKLTANDGQGVGEIIIGPDGTPMALIPAGEFQMGSELHEGEPDEYPVHTVHLDAFYMDVYEVSNTQYARFLNQYGSNIDHAGNKLLNISGCRCLIEKAGGIYRPRPGYENHPAVEVTWHGAAAYAQFYGKRLPTEAQWEKAARGGLAGKQYPFGDEISQENANYAGTVGRDEWLRTSPVNGFPPNGYGLYNMAGNVRNWCADWYSADYYAASPTENPQGPDSGSLRVIRGGGWNFDDPRYLRAAHRSSRLPSDSFSHVGFRCVSVP